MAKTLWTSQNSASRIWASDALPTTIPTNFGKFDYWYVTPTEKTYVRIGTVWTESHLKLGGSLTIVTGGTGTSSTIIVDSTTTLPAGQPATVTNIGTTTDVKLQFGIPQGASGIGMPGKDGTNGINGTVGKDGINGINGKDGINGINGKDGNAATINVGTVTTGAAGSNVSITNVGTPSAAILNFSIPRGADGAAGSGTGGSSDPSVILVGTNAELAAALQAAATNINIGKIKVYKPFTITTEMKIPNITRNFEMDGGNIIVTVNTPSGDAFTHDATDIGNANNIIDLAVHFHNWHLIDNNINTATTPRGNALRLAATYGSIIERNRFIGFDTQIKADFCLGLTIRNNRFWAAKTTNIYAGWAGIPGGNASASQSNVTRICDNVIRVENTGFAGIAVYGASGVIIDHNVIEGGGGASGHDGSQYGIFFDNSASPNVKSGTVSNNHFEVIFSKARCYARLSDGSFFYERNYFQYPGVDLESATEGYARFYVRYPDYMPNPTTYKNGGGIWIFEGTEYSFNESQATFWVNGNVPGARYSTGFGEGADKYYFIRASQAPKLNGKNIATI